MTNRIKSQTTAEAMKELRDKLQRQELSLRFQVEDIISMARNLGMLEHLERQSQERAALHDPVLGRVWDNPKDAVYDNWPTYSTINDPTPEQPEGGEQQEPREGWWPADWHRQTTHYHTYHEHEGGERWHQHPAPTPVPPESEECEHEWKLPVRSLAHGIDLLNNTSLTDENVPEGIWWCERCGKLYRQWGRESVVIPRRPAQEKQ